MRGATQSGKNLKYKRPPSTRLRTQFCRAICIHKQSADRVLNSGRNHQTYDLHSYAVEKRRALELLAARMFNIVEPAPADVASIEQARQRAKTK